MYYRSETAGRCRICAGQTTCVHSPDGSTFLRGITSCPPAWKYNVTSEIRLDQSTRIYLKNINPAEFHPDPIWNDGPWGFLARDSIILLYAIARYMLSAVHPSVCLSVRNSPQQEENKKNNKKMSSDIR